MEGGCCVCPLHSLLFATGLESLTYPRSLWSRLRVLSNVFSAAGPVGGDVCVVIARLYHGGALLFAAYSGPVGFPAIAQAAWLYGLGELSSAADPVAPLVDHVCEALGGVVLGGVSSTASVRRWMGGRTQEGKNLEKRGHKTPDF